MHLDNYYVPKSEDDYVAPEETFADATSDHAFVEVPIASRAFFVFTLGVGIILGVILIQSFRLQILQGNSFAIIAERTQSHHYMLPGLRGAILDRNDLPLVENIPVFDLVAVRSELIRADRPEFAVLLEEHKEDGVFVVQRDISKKEAIQYQSEKIPGIYVVASARRSYPWGPSFAHVLGYTSSITAEELDKNPTYNLHDRVGRLGLESQYEPFLHGRAFEYILDADAEPHVSQEAGQVLNTNLDAQLQAELYEAMDRVFRSAGVRRGAAVVQDVQTGGVLAIISMPTFDPNIFEETLDQTSASTRTRILEDNNKPLFNRAISGLYAPGSTVKPLYAMAGLREGTVDEKTTIHADGAIEIQSEADPTVYYTYRDWKVHGWTDILKAIADSVDVYFYALGGGYQHIEGLGIDRLSSYLRLFHADKKTGIDLPNEKEGFVPTRAWKQEARGDAWYVGDTYNVSIGQGDLVVTPLWINTYIAAIANGGKIMKPRIVKGDPEIMEVLNFDEKTFDIVRSGMRQTITHGTGLLLNDLPQSVAAKTGTAQITGRGLNSLFTLYAPYEDPKIAMTILVENIPQSQSLAMQVAKNFLVWYFSNR